METFRTFRQWSSGVAMIFLMGILFVAVNYGCSRGCSQQEAEQNQASAVTGRIPDTASEEQAGVSESEGKVLVARAESEDRYVVTDSRSEDRIIDTGTASGVQAGVASYLQPPTGKRQVVKTASEDKVGVSGKPITGQSSSASSLQPPTAQRQVAETPSEGQAGVAWAASEVPRQTTPQDRQVSEDQAFAAKSASEDQDSSVSSPPPPSAKRHAAETSPRPPFIAQQYAADPQSPPQNLGPGCYKKILGDDAGIYKNFKEGHPENASEWKYVGPVCNLDNMGPGCYKKLQEKTGEVVYKYFKQGNPTNPSGWTWIGYCCGSYGQ